MSRDRTESNSLSTYGRDDFKSAGGIRPELYYRDHDGRWIVPDVSLILLDLERCGGSIPILLECLLPAGSADEHTILLGAILLVVRADPNARERFTSLREAAEEALLITVHDQMYKNARKGDVQSAKFVLERRAKNLFGKDAKGVDDNEEWIKKKTKELQGDQ